MIGQVRANSRVKAIIEARYFVNIRPALATSLIEGVLKLSNIDRQRVITLVESI